MLESSLTKLRWQKIMPVGYVGQQSLVAAYEVSGSSLEWEGALTCVDIGCGAGAFSIHLARRFPQLTILGIDNSCEAISSAVDRCVTGGLVGRVQFAVFDIDNLQNYCSSEYDAIVSADAIQHSKQPIKLLEQIVDIWTRRGPIPTSAVLH